jgi:hypothetical protein
MKKVLAIILAFILISASLAGVYLTQRSTETRKEASSPDGTAYLSYTGPSGAQVGETLPITINVYTPDTPEGKGITGIKAIVSYTFSDSNPLSLDTNNIVQNLPSPWSPPMNPTVTVEGNTVSINIEMIYAFAGTEGYLGAVNSPVAAATLNFDVVAPGNINLGWDIGRSEIRAKNANEDILSTNLTTKNITLTGVATATSTPTPSQNPQSTTAPTPTSNQVSLISTSTPVPSSSAYNSPTPVTSGIGGGTVPIETTSTPTPASSLPQTGSASSVLFISLSLILLILPLLIL